MSLSADYERLVDLYRIVFGDGSERYNCSSRTQNEWYKEGIGFIEMLELWSTSFFNGYMSIVGGVFCTHPKIQIINGKLALFYWLTSSLACMFLAINRLSELTKIRWLKMIYDKEWKTRALIVFINLYGFYFAIFYDTPVYNSKHATVLVTPLNDYDQSKFNHLPIHHNPMVCLFMFLLYVSICCSTRKGGISNNWQHVNKLHRNLIIQSVLISSLYIVPSAFVFYAVFIDNTNYFIMCMGQITYQ
ncbi:unnamed protein product [Caenorhabditis angaria]|uniref:Serpentine receptor class gamma n=1 Tax=Caenorhabditis angaria TaxID=860376 RepID=A0A9P1ISY6_9PELO|nr:unnamed protein product [Caenorhabditis angaria]